MSFNSINSLLDKAVSVANAAATAAGKKTEEVVEASTLKLQQASLNSEISCCYEQLGKMVYAQKVFNECNEQHQNDMVAQISGLLEDLNSLSAKREEILKTKKCPNCGASCSTDSHFCSRCGMTLIPKTEEEAEEPEYVEAEVVCNKAEETVEEAAETVEEKAEDVAEAVEDAVEEAAEKVKEKLDD